MFFRTPYRAKAQIDSLDFFYLEINCAAFLNCWPSLLDLILALLSSSVVEATLLCDLLSKLNMNSVYVMKFHFRVGLWMLDAQGIPLCLAMYWF